MTQKYVNDIAYSIVGCAIEVHKHLGPGLLESVYHSCMLEELSRYDFNTQSEVWVPVIYKNKILESKLKLDILVNDLIIIELKAQENLIPLYKAQLLSYLKLTGKPKGLLINFHTENIVKDAVSLVTDRFSMLSKF
ncbi:MAG: GxxExxY protein [Sphingobacteriales bacterium]|nr:GxxExxY protein [Sphingobacteriales bacterium]